MNEMKVPSYIMRHTELGSKIGDRRMTTSCLDKGTITDNEDTEVRILELFYRRLLIEYCDFGGC